MHVSISVGELVDKVTIVAIRLAKIGKMDQVSDVYNELKDLEECFSDAQAHLVAADRPSFLRLRDKLRVVNEELWELEDEIRRSERNGDFGERFVEMARQVYKTNDLRAEVKAEINELTNSAVKEHKNYERYNEESQ